MNSFGTLFRVSLFGESHGPAVGALIDGCPAGVPLSEADFEADLARRRPGAPGTTGRREEDRLELLSGCFRGRTTGAPLTLLFRNADARSGDYEEFARRPRPGHADFVASRKWDGKADLRGGGHFSGRLTLPLVAAGVLAKRLVPEAAVSARLIEAGGIDLRAEGGAEALARAVSQAEAEGDSLGGLVECSASGLPLGLGSPFFDGLEALLSHLVFSIPGVRGLEFGDGFAAARMRGSEHNDPIVSADGRTARNGAGGINGGITNGNEIVFRVAFKPTSTIRKIQETWDFESGKPAGLSAGGRHDACFAQRTPVIVEAALAIVLADLSLRRKADLFETSQSEPSETKAKERS